MLFHCCFHKYDLLSQNSLLDYLQDVELVGGDVVAIATHCHFDHSGGLHNFSEVFYRDLSYMFFLYVYWISCASKFYLSCAGVGPQEGIKECKRR